jgi:acyl-CoA synthetase (AMP-forming)/AMP-acid ligase II
MMGYAESPADLALGDVQHGVLRTGDLGTVDDEGFYTLVGRLKRFAKLFGRRVNLEDVERELESAFPVRAIATERGDGLLISVAVDGMLQDQAAVAHLARFLSVPPQAILLRRIPELPLTSAGKKDYKALESAR